MNSVNPSVNVGSQEITGLNDKIQLQQGMICKN